MIKNTALVTIFAPIALFFKFRMVSSGCSPRREAPVKGNECVVWLWKHVAPRLPRRLLRRKEGAEASITPHLSSKAWFLFVWILNFNHCSLKSEIPYPMVIMSCVSWFF